METSNLVLALHVLVGLGLLAMGGYRLSLGRLGPGVLNVALAAVVVLARLVALLSSPWLTSTLFGFGFILLM